MQPGPGTYNAMNMTMGMEGKRYSLKSRVTIPDGKFYDSRVNLVYSMLDVIRLVTKQAIPGPGTYDPKNNIDKNGVYFLSTLE